MSSWPVKSSEVSPITYRPSSNPSDLVSGDEHHPGGLLTVPTTSTGNQNVVGPKLRRSQSRAFMSDDGMPQPIEFFVASDASAVVEHTKRVLYLEDDDIAHIAEGGELARRFVNVPKY